MVCASAAMSAAIQIAVSGRGDGTTVETPEEIAVSIAAQLIEVRAGGHR